MTQKLDSHDRAPAARDVTHIDYCAQNLPQVDLTNLLLVSAEDTRICFEICKKKEEERSPQECAVLDKLAAAYSPNQYSKATYERGYFVVTPSKKTLDSKSSASLIVQDIDTLWDPRKFNEPRLPQTIGTLSDRESYDQPCAPRCLHLPIKMPGTEIRIPEEYRQFSEAFSAIFDFEVSANPNFNDYYAYFTLDQRFVPKGQPQRIPGAHVDGIPRDRSAPQTQKIDHCYIITNNLPTRFYNQPFPVDTLDLNKHNVFALMCLLADDSKSILSAPYDINLINAYTVHTSIDASQHLFRTFMRVEFSTLKFDRRGNAINPYYDYAWSYRDCAVPDNLSLPENLVAQRIPQTTHLRGL